MTTDPFADPDRFRLHAAPAGRPPARRPAPPKGTGAWLPWAVVEGAVRLDLRLPSRHRVYWLLVCLACRYGGGEVRRSVREIAAATGLSERTVKAALAELIRDGHVRRPKRYRVLAVTLLDRRG